MNDFMFLYGDMIANIIGLIISIAIFLWIVKTLRKVVYPWIALAWKEYGPLPRSQKQNMLLSRRYYVKGNHGWEEIVLHHQDDSTLMFTFKE